MVADGGPFCNGKMYRRRPREGGKPLSSRLDAFPAVAEAREGAGQTGGVEEMNRDEKKAPRLTAKLFCWRPVGVGQILTTLAAWGPFCPWVTSNLTR